MQPASDEAKVLDALRPARPSGIIEVGENQVEKIVNRASFHDEASVHVGFAKRQRGIEEQAPFGAGVGETDDDRRPASVAEGMRVTVRVDQAQISRRNDMVESMPERAEIASSPS